MPAPSPRSKLPRSQRQPLDGATRTGDVSPDERFEVTVRVRRRAPIEPRTVEAKTLRARTYVGRDDYAKRYGSSKADLATIARFAESFGLTVVGTSAARRSVFLSGTVRDFSKAFGTSIGHYSFDGGTYRGRTGELTVPRDVADLIEGVFGIDDRPAARPQFQYRDRLAVAQAQTARIRAAAASASFTPPQLAKLYDFPTDVDGSDQTIALIELGGGYRPADLQTYFEGLGLAMPSIATVRVDGASNAPSTADSADGEVMLDIEVAAAVAPKAKIVVYFAPNTTKGFLDAITMAVHDTTHKPSVISISWGGAENTWTAQALDSYDQAFQGAATLGVTICCAAGDAGSGDQNPGNGNPDGLAHADFPASSPNVLACGGTRISVTNGRIAAETVWNDDPQRSATGGGISDHFALPPYQSSVGVPVSANPGGRRGRGVPDVCGDADPQTGYMVRVDGQDLVIGGTSAVAPLWAGLVALANQKLGKPVGFLNPLLYSSAKVRATMRDITSGNNGAYAAGVGWDACTGLGSPDGSKLIAALKASK
jgi:kumamolisin